MKRDKRLLINEPDIPQSHDSVAILKDTQNQDVSQFNNNLLEADFLRYQKDRYMNLSSENKIFVYICAMPYVLMQILKKKGCKIFIKKNTS